jgi:hypothetical protein
MISLQVGICDITIYIYDIMINTIISHTSGILYTWYVVVQDCMYLYEPVCTFLATWQYKKPLNGTYQSLLPQVIPRSVHTGMYCPEPALYKVVQGGTRWYKAVHDSTSNSTWWYMEVHGSKRIG